MSFGVGAFSELPFSSLPEEAGGTSYSLTLDTGEFTLTGNAVALAAQHQLAVGTGEFTLTGNAVSFAAARTLALATGEFTLTGNAVDFSYSGGAPYSLTLDTGAFTLTGNAVALAAQRALGLDTGSFTLTGNDAALAAQRQLGLATGSFTLTGNDVDFTYSGGGSPYSLTLDTGAFALNGGDAALAAARKLALATGEFTLTGNAVSFSRTWGLPLETGEFVLTGYDVEFSTTGTAEVTTRGGGVSGKKKRKLRHTKKKEIDEQLEALILDLQSEKKLPKEVIQEVKDKAEKAIIKQGEIPSLDGIKELLQELLPKEPTITDVVKQMQAMQTAIGQVLQEVKAVKNYTKSLEELIIVLVNSD